LDFAFFSRVLTTLSRVWRNKIGDEGAQGKAIAEALRGNGVASASAEKSIDFRANGLGDERERQ